MASARFPALVLASSCLLAVAFACGGEESASSDPDALADGGPSDGAPPPQRAEFGLDTRPANPTCKAPPRPASTVAVKLTRVYQNVELNTPMMLVQAPGDGATWYAALRNGTIVSFPVQNPGNTPTTVASLADLSGRAVQTGNEGGLLGMAFHPQFAQNGKLYVSWVTTGGPSGFRSEVGVLTRPNGSTTFTTYESVIDPFNQPAGNHNGGGIAFGKDGFLYLSFGDGGGGNDQYNYGQRTDTFFSKVLRIDVDNPAVGMKYGIPASNPFAQGGGEPATFAMGFRNPFRFSIDRETGEVWVGDVGQDAHEEIDRVKLGGNYGWPCREATHDRFRDRCPPNATLLDPVWEHPHPDYESITGGVVYRGTAIPGLQGAYIYGDYQRQKLHILTFDPVTGEPNAAHINEQGPAAGWVHFAEDAAGEVYAVALNGAIYKIEDNDTTGGGLAFPDRLSKTGCVDPANPRQITGGVPYAPNAELWSDGAAKERWMALPDGAKIEVGADGDFTFPIGTVLGKTFSLGGKPIETRLFVRHDDGDWGGYTYEWLDDGSDAVLLASNKSKTVGAQTWYFPSRAECMRCHTEAAGRSLGLELGQQHGDFVYTSTNRISNQLRTLEHIGMFAAPLPPLAEIAAYPAPFGEGAVDARARAYLHANCSMCHRPDGGGRSNMDLRFATPLASAAACNAAPEAGDLGIADAKLIVPGNPAASLVHARANSAAAATRMPPLATSVVDPQGVALLGTWIQGLTACP